MIKLLWESGYKVHGDMTRAEANRLSRHEGYAGYSYLKGQTSGLYYWFVHRDGHISDVLKADPAKTVDFPITREERTGLSRKPSSRHAEGRPALLVIK